MRYIIFKIHNKKYAIKIGKYLLDPTQINKITSVPPNGLITGSINYKGQTINVVDISKTLDMEDLKKFDGLLFVYKEKEEFAIKFEGFFKIKNEEDLSGEIIFDLNNISIT